MSERPHFLYSIATLAIGSILAIFVGLATGFLPTSIPRKASVIRATPPQKDCDCCRQMTPQELAASREQLAAL
ncbi:hypothetical protein F4141_23475 [Candidatus Poribacteria bacterium]|nr:hypothetical protein [Candidatus Poribacteria bacterium]